MTLACPCNATGAVVISKDFKKGGSMCNVINRVWFLTATPILSKMQI